MKNIFPPPSIQGVVSPSFLLPILCVAAPFNIYGTASRAFASHPSGSLVLASLTSWAFSPWPFGPAFASSGPLASGSLASLHGSSAFLPYLEQGSYGGLGPLPSYCPGRRSRTAP